MPDDFDQPPEFPTLPDPLAVNPPSCPIERPGLVAPIHDQPTPQIAMTGLAAALAQADHLRRTSRMDWRKLPDWPPIRDALEVWEAAFESQLTPLNTASQRLLDHIRRCLGRPDPPQMRSRAEIEAQIASGKATLAKLKIRNDSVASALEIQQIGSAIWALEWVLGAGEEK